MFDARRPMGRLFYLMVAVAVSHAQTPATTTINDVVYRGDGTPAGTVSTVVYQLNAAAAPADRQGSAISEEL